MIVTTIVYAPRHTFYFLFGSLTHFDPSSTQPGGNVVTTAIQSTSIMPATTGTSSSGSSSHVGAIAGGVVGGIVALLAIGAFIWLLRRRSQHEEFDGDFDPDRVHRQSRLGNFDLAAGGHDTTVTPFMVENPASSGLAGVGIGAAAAAGGASLGALEAGHHQRQTSTSSAPPSSWDHHSAAFVGPQGPGFPPQPQPPHSPESSTGSGYMPVGPPSTGGYAPSAAPTSESAYTPSSQRSAKEREAMRYRALHLTNTPDGGETSGLLGGAASPPPPSRTSTEVLQHRDGGRLEEAPHEQPPSEIPPSYDSIPRDERSPAVSPGPASPQP